METFIGVLLGGGILTFLQFLISRWDKKHDRLAEVKKAIDGLEEKILQLSQKSDERDAENRRVRILRFEDELQAEKRHSKESFDQVMQDITEYENYCRAHPDFKNHQTKATIEHIDKVYHDRLEKRDFK